MSIAHQLGTPYPEDISAERALLGAVLLDPEVWFDVQHMLKPEDFYHAQHGRLWALLHSMRAAGLGIDAVTVTSHIHHDAQAYGGVPYVSALTSYPPATKNAATYAASVLTKSRQRRAMLLGEEVREAGERGDLARVTQLATKLSQVMLTDSTSTCYDSAAIADRAWASLEAANSQTNVGLRSGLWPLDDALGVILPGELVVIGGRPGEGKTALAMAWLHYLLKWSHRDIPEDQRLIRRAYVQSLEMTDTELQKRLWSQELADNREGVQVAYRDMRTPQMLGQEEWDALYGAKLQSMGWSCHVEVSRNLTVEQMVGMAKAEHARRPFDVWVIDYLQLVNISDHATPHIGYAHVTKTLKGMAGEADLNCAVLLLSQLNRDQEKRKDKRILKSDFRDSGGIESDADVMLGCRGTDGVVDLVKARAGMAAPEAQLVFDRGLWLSPDEEGM